MTLPARIDELPVPPSLDGAGSADFRRAVELSNRVDRAHWGHDDFAVGDAAALVQARGSAYEERRMLVARDGAAIIGRASLSLPLADNTHLGHVYVQVLPEHRRRGTGSALLLEAVRILQAAGRGTVWSWSDHHVPPADAPVVRPTTGAGALDSSDAAVRFAAAHGFALEQVERIGVLDLPDAPEPPAAGQGAARPGRDAWSGRDADGGDYKLVQWGSSCPEELLAEYADLRRQMSLDVPTGGLDLGEERWDPARVRDDEAELIRQQAGTLVAAVRHVPTGALVGHSVLERFEYRPEIIFQGDTLVLAAHRGHGLGLRLKWANLRRLAERYPGARRIYTYNAVENSPMLAVNDELGFRAAGFTAAWQKRLVPR
jgi:GNAT superfamily N-acetyltransferase/RimJ/RimL family protein N-acetyltransferase